jgi:hypothetical protein
MRQQALEPFCAQQTAVLLVVDAWLDPQQRLAAAAAAGSAAAAARRAWEQELLWRYFKARGALH